jgi:hypothetical protein
VEGRTQEGLVEVPSVSPPNFLLLIPLADDDLRGSSQIGKVLAVCVGDDLVDLYQATNT